MSAKTLKVLELASVLAGPSVGSFFAELGAKVYKVESPAHGGDITRSWRLPRESGKEEQPISAYYASVNVEKELLWLDLRKAQDRERIYALLPEIDIVLANYKAGSAEKLGMDYANLRKYNPRLLYAQLSGFGSDEAERVAFDVVLQAESGFMYMNGQSNGPATKMPVALIDILAAHQLKEALLYGLWQRERDGRGRCFEVSLLGSALASLANQAGNYLMQDFVPQRQGSLHPNIAPYGEILEHKELQLVLAVGSDKQFAKLCELLGLVELAQDSRFASNQQRVRHREALQELLQEAFAALPEPHSFVQLCHREQVPVGRIRTMAEVFELPLAQRMTIEDSFGRRLSGIAFEEKQP